MNFKSCLFFVLAFAMSATSVASGQQKVDFVSQIKPILEKHCMQCHNTQGDQFPIENREESLGYLTAGDPENSEIYTFLISDDEFEQMPPPDFERPLNQEQIELVKTWIQQGADWPEDAQFVMWQPEDPSDDPGAAGAATDQPEQTNIDPRIFKAVGSLHPAILHLPMGLILAAGFFALLSLRGNFVMSDCAYYCLWLGVLTGVLACVSGWYISETSGKGTVSEVSDLWDMSQKVSWHRASALIGTVLGFFLALFAKSARAQDPDEGVTWKLGAILLAALFGYVGMTGGKLVYPSNHYQALEELIGEMFESEEPQPAPSSDSELELDELDIPDAPASSDTSGLI